MVLLIATPDIREGVKKYNSRNPKSPVKLQRAPDPKTVEERPQQDDSNVNNTQRQEKFIDHLEVAKVAESIGVPLIQILRNTSIYCPPPTPRPVPSPEHVERMEKLRIKLKEKEYQSMIATTMNPSRTVFSLHEQHDEDSELNPYIEKEIRHQISTIINILLSVVAVSFAVFTWARYWQPALRVLVSFFTGLLVLVAESFLYYRYVARIDEAKTTERKRQENKQVTKVHEITAGNKEKPE